MTLTELEHIFRFQTTATDDYVPKDTLDYVLINGQNRIMGTANATALDKTLASLNEGNYVFDAYRDRTPVFIVPEVILPM
jgi:hypothetical protein